MQCILCGSLNNKIVFRENKVNILNCVDCGHYFSDFKQSQNYADYYGDQAMENADLFWWNQAHEKMYYEFIDLFIKKDKGVLLDVGCGLGFFVKKISEKTNWDCFGCELSKTAAEYAKNNLRLAKILNCSLSDVNLPDASVDIITMWDVIEHIPDPYIMTNKIFGLLKENGILFIHTPNVKIQLIKSKIKKYLFGGKGNVHYMEAKDHINIYSEKAIKELLKKSGFNKVFFIQLSPIQSVSGSKNKFKIFIKNLWFLFSKILFKFSNGYININNLFVVAIK